MREVGDLMVIRVEDVTAQSIRLGSTVSGYRVRFTAGPVEGQAWFAWSAEDPPPAPGEYSVETGVQAVRVLRIVGRATADSRGLVPLTTPCDFRVRGLVEMTEGEGRGPGAWAYVRAGDWTFSIDLGDCSGADRTTLSGLARGDEVEFEAIGLSLWDAGL